MGLFHHQDTRNTKRFLAAAIAAALAVAAQGQEVAEVLEKVREVLAYEQLARQTQGVMLEGRTEHLGVEGRGSLLFTPAGKFFRSIESRLGDAAGWDGATAWTSDWTGMPRRLHLGDRENQLAHFWILTGRWLAADSPFVMAIDGADEKTLTLSLKLKDTGVVASRLALDRATWRPVRLVREQGDAEMVTEFSDYRKALGFFFPHQMVQTSRGVTSRFHLERARSAPRAAEHWYAPPSARPADTHFDPNIPARLEVRRARTGHLLVHPQVEGRDAGWFILDSGAGSWVMDPQAAAKLGLESFGQIPVVGLAGATISKFRKGSRVQLGPLTIRNPVYVEMALDFLKPLFGVDIAGLAGYDLLSRAVVEIDATAPAVAVHDPAAFRLPEQAGPWRELIVETRVPAVRCSFEGDRDGVFVLDTGSNAGVLFYAPAVEKLELLKGRDTSETRAAGVGGMLAARSGKLAWFDLAGHRFENLVATFAQGQQGAVRSPFITGNLGGAFLAPFTIYFHYAEEKIAFRRKPAQPESNSAKPPN
jgi:hypothetical protein